MLQKGTDVSKIALILSISGKIARAQLPAYITDEFIIYEIMPKEVDPTRNTVNLESTLVAFRTIYQKLMRQIEGSCKNAKKIHLFPAIPVSIAVVCGRELMKDVSPSLLVYDKVVEGYNFIMEVN